MPTNLGRQLDVVVASAFLLIGAASTALSYNNIKDLEVTQAVLFDDPLPRGTQVFDIRADGECVGHIDVTLNYLEVGHLVSKGLVLSQYKGTAIPVHISSDIKFNPLGQMILSETKVRSPVVSFSLETENTNPIHTTIRAQFGTQSYSGSPSFGGPVTLTERGNNAFTLEYSRRSSQYSNLLTSPVNYVKDGLKLSIERLDEDKSLCRDAELGEINLEPIIEMFQHLASDVSKYSINLGSLGQ